MDYRIPVYHRIMPGNILSVRTVESFAMKLKDFGVGTIMTMMDRGFYSTKNIRDLENYSIIGEIAVYPEGTRRNFCTSQRE